MGNCIETYSAEVQFKSPTDLELHPQLPPLSQQELLHDDDGQKGNDKNMMNARIKIVLRKEELEWLMEQLNNSSSSNTTDQIGKKQKLEELLWEIQRSRENQTAAQAQPWRPCLETIPERD